MANSMLDRLAEEYFALFAQAAPVVATIFGIPGHDAELPDISERGQADVARRMAAIRDRVQAIDPRALTEVERTTRALLVHECQSVSNAHESRELEWAVGQYASPINLVLSLIPKAVLNTPDKTRDYHRRCLKLPVFLEQWITRLRHGVRNGLVGNRHTVVSAVAQLDRYLAGEVAEDPLLRPVRDSDDPSYRGLADVIADGVRPGMHRVREVLADEVLPAARPDERCGILHVPGGEAIYRRAVRQHTTTDRSAEEVHDLGRQLLESLREQFAEVGPRVLGIRDVDALKRGLREDAGLRYRIAAELIDDAAAALRRAEDAVPDWFGRLSRIPCELAAMNAAEGEVAAAGYYQPPADDGTRPGRFWINTANPPQRCRYETETVTFHESIPGHHLQFARARDLTGLPEFRRFAYVSASGEGWGCYAERLADEMGLYSGDLARLGMMSFDALRASRLVVDTGMHAFGWTRQHAIDFLYASTAVPWDTVTREVDRYINWPGQALAYMTGREEINDLRDLARTERGASFDIKEFHDMILGGGSIPLTELRLLVHRWLQEVVSPEDAPETP